MTDFCDFVPDDPSCQVTPPPKPDPVDPVDPVDPTPTDGGDASGDDKGDTGDMTGKDDWSSMDDKKAMTWEEFDAKASEYFHPMEANIAYFSIAAGFVTDLALRTFVWHETNADTKSQAASGASNTDYYHLMHQIEAYGGMALWGTAAFTQLLATFGIMTGINMMVWGTLVPMVGGLLTMTVAVIGMIAYNQFWDQWQNQSNSTAESYLYRMEREMALHEASHIAGHFEMYLEMSSWLWGAYMASSDEEKAKWREDKEFLMMLDLTPEKVKEWGMDGEDKEMKEMKEGDDKMSGPPSLLLKIANF